MQLKLVSETVIGSTAELLCCFFFFAPLSWEPTPHKVRTRKCSPKAWTADEQDHHWCSRRISARAKLSLTRHWTQTEFWGRRNRLSREAFSAPAAVNNHHSALISICTNPQALMMKARDFKVNLCARERGRWSTGRYVFTLDSRRANFSAAIDTDQIKARLSQKMFYALYGDSFLLNAKMSFDFKK